MSRKDVRQRLSDLSLTLNEDMFRGTADTNAGIRATDEDGYNSPRNEKGLARHYRLHDDAVSIVKRKAKKEVEVTERSKALSRMSHVSAGSASYVSKVAQKKLFEWYSRFAADVPMGEEAAAGSDATDDDPCRREPADSGTGYDDDDADGAQYEGAGNYRGGGGDGDDAMDSTSISSSSSGGSDGHYHGGNSNRHNITSVISPIKREPDDGEKQSPLRPRRFQKLLSFAALQDLTNTLIPTLELDNGFASNTTTLAAVKVLENTDLLWFKMVGGQPEPYVGPAAFIDVMMQQGVGDVLVGGKTGTVATGKNRKEQTNGTTLATTGSDQTQGRKKSIKPIVAGEEPNFMRPLKSIDSNTNNGLRDDASDRKALTCQNGIDDAQVRASSTGRLQRLRGAHSLILTASSTPSKQQHVDPAEKPGGDFLEQMRGRDPCRRSVNVSTAISHEERARSLECRSRIHNRLYEAHLDRTNKSAMQATTQDTEFDENCTFKPVVRPAFVKRPTNVPKGYMQEVFRMRNGVCVPTMYTIRPPVAMPPKGSAVITPVRGEQFRTGWGYERNLRQVDQPTSPSSPRRITDHGIGYMGFETRKNLKGPEPFIDHGEAALFSVPVKVSTKIVRRQGNGKEKQETTIVESPRKTYRQVKKEIEAREEHYRSRGRTPRVQEIVGNVQVYAKTIDPKTIAQRFCKKNPGVTGGVRKQSPDLLHKIERTIREAVEENLTPGYTTRPDPLLPSSYQQVHRNQKLRNITHRSRVEDMKKMKLSSSRSTSAGVSRRGSWVSSVGR